MLKIEPLTKDLLISVLELLVKGKVSREEVVTWHGAMMNRFGYTRVGADDLPLRVNDGYWEFVSLSSLMRKSEILSDKSDFFLRQGDFINYLGGLQGKTYEEISNEFQFVRQHEFTKESGEYRTLLYIMDEDIFTRNSMSTVRGILSSLSNLQELSIFEYQGLPFSISLHHEHDAGSAELNGMLHESMDTVVKLLDALKVSSDSIHWISPDLDSESCQLTRLDDNDNTFVIKEYDSYIKAELTRIEFENKGHKQTYRVVREN